MAKVPTNISIDEDIKAKAQALFSDFGLDLSTAINIFLRQSVRENAIPFVIQREVPNALTLETIEKADRGEDLYGPFNTFDELMESLNA